MLNLRCLKRKGDNMITGVLDQSDIFISLSGSFWELNVPPWNSFWPQGPAVETEVIRERTISKVLVSGKVLMEEMQLLPSTGHFHIALHLVLTPTAWSFFRRGSLVGNLYYYYHF